MMSFVGDLILLLGVALLTRTSAENAGDYARLKADLLQSYDKELLPQYKRAIRVDMSMSLYKLRGLDIFKGTIQMSVWMQIAWTDSRLAWDPEDYGNITDINLQPSEVWVPDIRLYNSDSPTELNKEVSVYVMNFGWVSYFLPMQLDSTCTMDLRDYPYDQHNCSLKWGSWAHSNSSIKVGTMSDAIDLYENAEGQHPIWEIVDTKATKQTTTYDCCPDYYDTVTFSVLLRRRETHGRIAASVVTTWLILIVFLIRPPSAGERIVFAGFIFVALVVLSAALSAQVPAYSVTRLGRFLIGGMLIVAIVSIINGFIYRCYTKEKPGELIEGDGSSRSRTIVVIDIAAFLCTAIILGVSTGALFV